MLRKSHWFRYGVCSLVALGVFWSAAEGLQASWQAGAEPDRAQPGSPLIAQPHDEASNSESGSDPAHAESVGESEPEEHGVLEAVFHWFNFLLILGGIGYLVRKFLVPFLEERGRAIREDMERSAGALAEANQRLSTIEEKLKRLDKEIGALRQSALQEAAAERARIEELAKADANKILVAAGQEIEAAVKAARQELKVYTAQLALDVAEKKIRESLTPQAEQRLLRSFLQGLAGDSTRGGNGEPPRHPGRAPVSSSPSHKREP